ncbi:putative uncharacterized protein PH1206 [Ruminococcus sp. CAG:382]|nr:putative uncharacterized protein PH1206 [Ruminococcus sp. CAG:382]
MRLSRSDESVLVAIIAGTEQPKPISMGTIDRPDKPSFLRGLSITKAMRAIYPESSSTDRKKKRTTMSGRKLSTLPTPANTPSIIRLCITGFMPYDVSALSTISVSEAIPISIRSPRKAPITSKVR